MEKKLEKQKNVIMKFVKMLVGPGNKKEEPITSIIPKIPELVTPIISIRSICFTQVSYGPSRKPEGLLRPGPQNFL